MAKVCYHSGIMTTETPTSSAPPAAQGTAQPNVLLVGNGPYQNRGCEAITRGTLQIIRRSFAPAAPRFISIPFNLQQRTAREDDPGIVHRPISIKRYTPIWFVQNSLRAVRSKRTWMPEMGRYIRDAAAVLALGGDNYTMDYRASLRVHLSLLDYVRAHQRPMVIWGASMGPFDKRGPDYERQVLNTLRMVDAIFVREGITADYLARHGVERNVRRVADPAFVMEPQAPDPARLGVTLPADAIGFNFSPLMARFVAEGDLERCTTLVRECVRELIQRLDRPVILVPHVFTDHSNDFTLLQAVAAPLQAQGLPVTLLPPTLSAAEIKWVISRLACFAGARTHATIAAFSSAVPTLSFAYSTKARGLNRDLFGHEEFVLPPDQITPEATTRIIQRLLAEQRSIRAHLEQTLPQVREQAFLAGTYLAQVVRTGTLA